MKDVRLALRSLRHAATFTAAVTATLGIGIGMTTAMLTVYKAVLIDRFPIVAQDRIVVMHPLDRRGANLDVMDPYLDEIARDSALFRGVAGVYHMGARTTPLLYSGAAIHLDVVHASSNFFDLLGMRPAAGRFFRPEDGDPGAPPVVVLSNSAWRRLGGDPSIVGQALGLPVNTSIPQQQAEIIGVAPPGFDYPTGADAWLPLPRGIQLQVDVIARLAPHVTMNAARAGLFALTQRSDPFATLRADNDQDPKAFDIAGIASQSFVDTMVGHPRPVIVALTVAIALLLVIACINIGNLMLVRLVGRGRDIAVRHALGATPGDIARLFAIEATILVTAGGTLGCLLALGALRLLRATAIQLPRIDMLDAVGAPLAAAAGLSVGALVLFGSLLSVVAPRMASYATLRADSRSGADSRPKQRARRILVATQIALTLVMLTGAGLLARTLARLQSLDLGYQPDHLSILAFTSFTGPQGGVTTPAQITQMYQDLVMRIEATPGVVAASPIEQDPFKGQAFFGTPLVAADRPVSRSEHVPFTPFDLVGPDYFRTLEIPICRGRGFRVSDTKGSPPVVVISETLARQFWPNQDPIGKQVIALGDSIRYTVVGVARDTRFRELKNVGPVVYYDWTQMPSFLAGWLVAVRTKGPMATLLPSLRAVIRDVNPHLIVSSAQTMDELLGAPLAQPRLSALLMTAFGLVALLLSTIGLYGVISSAARQQTHDIGVRIALGAQSRDVHRLVLGDALSVLGAGAAIGIVVALNVGHVLSSQLFAVSPIDPVSLAIATTVLLAVGLGAAYLPAHRASRIDPVEVLRSE